MSIHTLLSELETASRPVVQVIQAGKHHKVLAIGFRKDMTLREHQTLLPAKLLVIQGTVTYREGPHEYPLNQYDEKDIPVRTIHSVSANTDALCILIQGEPS